MIGNQSLMQKESKNRPTERNYNRKNIGCQKCESTFFTFISLKWADYIAYGFRGKIYYKYS